jgi:hypothetical protein
MRWNIEGEEKKKREVQRKCGLISEIGTDLGLF